MLFIFLMLVFDLQAISRRDFCKTLGFFVAGGLFLNSGCQFDQFTTDFDPDFKMPKNKSDSVLHNQADDFLLQSFFSQSSLEFLVYDKTLYYYYNNRDSDEKIKGFHYKKPSNYKSIIKKLSTLLKDRILDLKKTSSTYQMTHKHIFSFFEKFSEKNQKEMEQLLDVLNLKSVSSLDGYKKNVFNEIKKKFKLDHFNEKESKIFFDFFKNRSKLYSISYDVAWSLFFYDLKFELIKERKIKNREKKISQEERGNNYDLKSLKETLEEGAFKNQWKYYSENIYSGKTEYNADDEGFKNNIFLYAENFFYNIHLKWKDYIEKSLMSFKGDEELLRKYFDSNFSIEYEDYPDFVLVNTASMLKETNPRKNRHPSDLFEDLIEHFRQYQFGGFHVLTHNISNPLSNLKGNYFKEIHDYPYRNLHLFHKGDYIPFLTVLERIEQFVKIYLTIGGDRDYFLSLIPFYLFFGIFLDKKDKIFSLKDNILIPQRMILKDNNVYKQNTIYSKKNFSFDFIDFYFDKKNFLKTRTESKNSSRKNIGLNDWDYMSYIGFYLKNENNINNLEQYLVEVELFFNEKKEDDFAHWIYKLIKKTKRLKEVKNKDPDSLTKALAFLYAYIQNPFQREFIYEEFYLKSANGDDHVSKKGRIARKTFNYYYNVFTTKTL